MIGQPLAIHAAKRKDETGVWRWMQHKLNIQEHQRPDDFEPAAVKAAGESFHALPFGAIVCLVRVEAVWQVGNGKSTIERVSPVEAKWGDYSEGRYYWQLKPFYVFDTPIPCTGNQGIFDWTIPQEWIEQAAKEAGIPGLAEVWKAVHAEKQ